MKSVLFNPDLEYSSCGVGLITHKESLQTHEIIQLAEQALCKVPHRGGMNAEGVGDGGGVNFDLSVRFYRHITGLPLRAGEFAIGNFFMPKDSDIASKVSDFLREILAKHHIVIVHERQIPVNNDAINAASVKAQLPIVQWVLKRPDAIKQWDEFELLLNKVLLEIEEKGLNEHQYPGFYPLSFSSRTQVYKGRLNAWEVIAYFKDLHHPEHEVSMLFFHTRFSTNTAPNPLYAQPFRHLAHNGELNTDRKSRISELAIARQQGFSWHFPPGQSDSARLDQTLTRRLVETQEPIEELMIRMMPPAWENNQAIYSQEVRDMLAYFSLSEEKNDGPAGLAFCDGIRIGAALDRLGLRPLRTVETDTYFVVTSEAGQIDFPPESVISRGRIEAGGMVVFDHETKQLSTERDILKRMASKKDYGKLLNDARIRFADLPQKTMADLDFSQSFGDKSLYMAYSLNQESFKFLLDPMLINGAERVSAMGYGLAPNGLTDIEGGMSRYFTQRFAQVTNPPLDSIRESDGMTLRVTLGGKPQFVDREGKRVVLESPVLQPQHLQTLLSASEEGKLYAAVVETLYDFKEDSQENERALEQALQTVCEKVLALARSGKDIIVLDDMGISRTRAALPAVLTIAAANRRLIEEGLRFHTSLVYRTGQICSTHDVALLLGFGASAVMPQTAFSRARELLPDSDVPQALDKFQKAVHKALMKTMGKFGLCTVESYSGGAFFEPSFLNVDDPRLKLHFPNLHSPIGGASFSDIAYSSWEWHRAALEHDEKQEVPLLGLFKEVSGGAGHSFGHVSVKTFTEMTNESIQFAEESVTDGERLDILPQDDSYLFKSHQKRTTQEIDAHKITPAYREFVRAITQERQARPAALRDVLDIAQDISQASNVDEMRALLDSYRFDANAHSAIKGIQVERKEPDYEIVLLNADKAHLFAQALQDIFADDVTIKQVQGAKVIIAEANHHAKTFLDSLMSAPASIDLNEVQPAHEITAAFAGGAMSHGALLYKAHEAVAMGVNMVGGMSNSGEGGEHSSRFNSLRASRIKQIASGRFGVWAGYFADPMLEEIEIKIGQGAKPGEGGQLPAKKVSVEIAAARGGTPGVELVSPPPHHDTYSIEDLAQLIHDCKAARVRVIVKLVSTEGIGTIAVGVAKAGADVINVAGNTGGTGAAQVTSLKNTGRIPELGLAEVHQALSLNGLRDKVILRCSGAHQTGLDIIKSCMLGGDSFEFGTTTLMMLKCVMAKNCNIKCPVGLTTDHEVFDGDPRALAQYLLNIAHEVREWLAYLGFKDLRSMRGRADLLHLINHPCLLGDYRMDAFLRRQPEIKVASPVYLQAKFDVDDELWTQFKTNFSNLGQDDYLLFDIGELHNYHKSVGGQFSIDIERYLQYEIDASLTHNHPKILQLTDGRKVLTDNTVMVSSEKSAGQSFGAFNNSGITLIHQGTANDGVGKSMCGGRVVITNPGGGSSDAGQNVLIGNFALFGATGGALFVQGEAGDRFGVRNSGAIAVIEGVGDFACEYMTNGAIVNLGSFGKGFANGMSGGVAFQYDPSGMIVKRASRDSVAVLSIAEEGELAKAQEEALLWYLEQHLSYTQSPLVESLLADWSTARAHFYFMIPKAWITYHTADAIATAIERKDMVQELAKSTTANLMRVLQTHYQQQQPLFAGKIPQLSSASSVLSQQDRALIAEFAVMTGVLFRAQEEVIARGATDIDNAAKQLILNNNRQIMDRLFKDIRSAIEHYDDRALATLLASQRLQDYQRALSLRESFDSYALSTNAWVLYCQRQNKQALQHFESLPYVMAKQFNKVLAERMSAQANEQMSKGVVNV